MLFSTPYLRFKQHFKGKMMMKAKFLCLTLAILGQGALAQTQGTSSLETSAAQSEYNGSVGVEPIWLLLGGIGAKAEYFMTQKISLGVDGTVIPSREMKSNSPGNAVNTNYVWSHNQFNLGTTLMLSGTLSTNGFYLNPKVGYQSTRITDFGTEKLQGSLSTPQASATIGYQWITPNSPLKLTVGAGYRVLQAGEIVIKDKNNKQIYSQNASNISGLAFDFQLSLLL
jgi:hypothetical protein